MAASKTETNVKNADIPASLESVSKVRGRELKKDTMATMAEKTTVQRPPLVIVFRYFEPVKQWKP